MALRIERDVLADAVTTARAAVSRTGMAAMRGVHLEAVDGEVTVTGTDLDMTIRVTAKGSGDIDTVLPAALFADVVKSLPAGAVAVAADSEARKLDEVTIESGRTVVRLRPYPVADFARTPEVDADEVVVDGTDLAKALHQVVGAASSDDARPILTGVLLASEGSGLRLVATDSYRLAIRDVPGLTGVVGEGASVLVPRSALSELERALRGGDTKVRIRIGAHAASFSVGGVCITSRLIEGEFPNYRNLVPAAGTQPNRLTFGREPLVEALKRMLTVDKSSAPVLRMSLGDETGMFGVSMASAEIGEAKEDVDGDYEGAPLKIAFNPNYLRYGAEACTGDRVVLSMSDSLKPATLTATDDPSFTYLLMPVRT